jgi:hypothetical protein
MESPASGIETPRFLPMSGEWQLGTSLTPLANTHCAFPSACGSIGSLLTACESFRAPFPVSAAIELRKLYSALASPRARAGNVEIQFAGNPL